MKKLATIVICLVMLLSMTAFPVTAQAGSGYWQNYLSIVNNPAYTFTSGAGTQGDPYIISTTADLTQLAVNANNGMNYSGVYFRLDADLDLAGYFWKPIASLLTNGFCGSFNGDNHTISNMNVDDSDPGVGLFGSTIGATIENLTVSGTVNAGNSAGILVGSANAETVIHNCMTSGTVTVTGGGAGGLVGSYGTSLGTIDGCSSSANVSGPAFVGGLVGVADAAHIKNSYATGTVTATSSGFCAGGFVGGCNNGTIIEHCYTTGNVSAFQNAGGFVGDTSDEPESCTFTNCYARGNATVETMMGGAFAGNLRGAIVNNCYGSGSVTCTKPDEALFIGGFTGGVTSSSTFANCFYDRTKANMEAVGMAGVGSEARTGILGLATANMQGLDTLLLATKMDILRSGAGAPVAGVPIWYAHSANYPDFVLENCTVTFDSQGATTAAAPATKNVLPGSTIDALPTNPVRTGCVFGNWYTAINGGGTQFTAATVVSSNMTVYAKWTKDSAKTIYVKGRQTLTPLVSGGTWTYDSAYLTLTQNSDGTATIKGLKAGTTIVQYTSNGLIEVYNVTIKKSKLPSTGQDMTTVYTLLGVAVCLFAAGSVFGLRRGKNRA